MAKHGKKYKAAAAKVNIDQLYMPKEAMALARDTTTTKFDSTVEVHIRTGGAGSRSAFALGEDHHTHALAQAMR